MTAMGAHRRHTRPGPVARLRGVMSAWFYGTVTVMSDLLPPHVRYGYVHRIARLLWGRRPLPALEPVALPSTRRDLPPVAVAERPRVTCVLGVDDLEVGGIGSVIEMLADGLGGHGITPVVLARQVGARGRALAGRGVDVHRVTDRASAERALGSGGRRVIQLHSAPAFLEAAAAATGWPIIPVLHNTEIHFTRTKWGSVEALLRRSAVAIAVSETVRDFYLLRLSEARPFSIAVVPNGAPQVGDAGPGRATARAVLGRALDVELADDVVFACLARYDSQKNIAGTVASFLRSIEARESRQRLIVAGDPSDWVEVRRAAGILSSNRYGDRVHLLGRSDATTLLTAADAFVLDSFFEGWAVAATEARAFGLPLVLSDVGGGRELCRGERGSFLVGNPSGLAAEVSGRRVARARRRVRHQVNANEVSEAVRRVTDDVLRRRALHLERRPVASASADAMVAEHAQIILQVASIALATRQAWG